MTDCRNNDDDQGFAALVDNRHRASDAYLSASEEGSRYEDEASLGGLKMEKEEPTPDTSQNTGSCEKSSSPKMYVAKKKASASSTDVIDPEECHSSAQLTTAAPEGASDNNMLIADTEAEEDQARQQVPQDSFSMFYVADTFFEYVIPVGTFGLQLMILILILINLLQTDDRPLKTNNINVPVDVPRTVTVSQYIACLVSVFTADDLIAGMLHVGTRVVCYSHVGVAPPAISTKWEVSNLMRMLEGALVISVSFIFIAQSATAIDLWLNFAGVTFVGLLDDTAFALAKIRFLGNRAKKLADKVSDIQIYNDPEKNGEKRMRAARIVLFVGITVAMWAGLSVIVKNQNDLKFACSSITITAGESNIQHVRHHYSGTYFIQATKINQRAVYVQKQGRGAFLAYCNNDGINRWTVTAMLDRYVPEDPCSEYELQSERTRAYDITEISDLQFFSGDNAANADIKCNDCSPKRSRPDCGWKGECIAGTKSCHCDVGHFGDKCQFKGPCTELSMHKNFHAYNYGYEHTFDLLYLDSKPVMVYDRPVYAQKLSPEVLGAILFDGGRWIVSQSDTFEDWDPTGKDFAKYLADDFNAETQLWDTEYISEPSSFGDPMGVTFKALLADGVGVSIGEVGEEEFDLLCADCSDGTSGISNCVDRGGFIDEDICLPEESNLHGQVKRCNCTLGFDGPLCHIRPIEGPVVIHMDVGTDVCSTCGEGNTWSAWDLDGNENTCLPSTKGPLVFDDAHGTFVRQVSLNLNSTHFSVFVSSNMDEETLCEPNEGTKEIHSIKRNVSDERIKINYAIHLNKTRNFFGEIVDPENIDCLATTDIAQSICISDLMKVYGTSSRKSSLEHAWILLDLKITPIN